MARHFARRDGHRSALTLALLLVVSMIAWPALAGPSGSDDGPKSYAAEILPSSPCVGVPTQFALTLRNTSPSGQPQLGSADITSDLGATAVDLGGDAGTARVVGDTIELRDLALLPGDSATVLFTGTAATAGQHVLDIVVKQANNFRGNPGNDFPPPESPVSVEAVTTGCFTLAFRTQPGDAVVDSPVPGASGALSPAVQLVDAAGDIVPVDGVTVAMTLQGGTATGFTSDSTTSVATVDGVATFDNLVIASTGVGHTLRAAVGDLAATSGTFNVLDVLCGPDTTCSTTTSNRDGDVTATGQTGGTGGGFALGFVTKTGGVCGAPAGYDMTRLPSEVLAQGVGFDSKLITFQVGKQYDQRQSNNGVSFYQVCAAPEAPFTQFSSFTDRFGNLVGHPDDPYRPAGPYATSGLLPDCGANGGVAPCVVSRTKSQNGSPIITVLWGSGFRFG